MTHLYSLVIQIEGGEPELAIWIMGNVVVMVDNK